MSRLDKLIQRLCPNGVEYKAIKNTYKRVTGTPITARKMKEIEDISGEIKIFAGGKTVINAHEKDIPNANITRVPAVLVQSRGIIDVVYYDRPFTFKNEMWAYTAKEAVSVKFLYHVLKNNIKKFRETASSMGSLPQISLGVTEDFLIPVLPLEVQREIVSILDNFTDFTVKLTSDLTSEITLRKRQYEYYRDKLLANSYLGTVEYKKLWEVTIWDKKFSSVENYKQPIVITYPYISANDLFKLQQDEGDVFLLSTGEKTGWTTEKLAGTNLCEGEVVTIPWGKSRKVTDVMKYYKGKFVTSDNRIATSNDTEILLNKFLFYWLQSQGTIIDSFYRGSGLKHPYMKAVLDMDIPIPPIEEQTAIINILDNFCSTFLNISIDLPAEIEARQKQYEYYREKLLTFKEKRV